MSATRAPRRWRRWGVSAGAFAFLAVFLFPVYWMVNASLQEGASSTGTGWWPDRPSLGGYRLALDEQLPYIATSGVVAVGAVVCTLLIAVPAGFALAQLRGRTIDVLLIACFVAQIIPSVVMATGLFSFYARAGLLNTHLAIILADATLAAPLGILLVRAFVQRLPEELFQAALVDGAGWLKTFLLIVVPLSRNVVITVSVFSFLFAWGDLVFAITMSTSPEVRPFTAGIYDYLGGGLTRWDAAMAAATLAAVPSLLILTFAQRSLTDGITLGAVR